MTFICGMCQNEHFSDNLAFTYEYYDADGIMITEGCCGNCAEDACGGSIP